MKHIREFHNYEEDRYEIIERLWDPNITDPEKFSDWCNSVKGHYKCDKIFLKDGKFLACKKIEDAIIVNDEPIAEIAAPTESSSTDI